MAGQELDVIVGGIAARATGSEAIEAYAEEVTHTDVTAYEGAIERLTSASSRGVGIRVVRDGRLGYAYTADLSEPGLAACLQEARENLAVSSVDPGNVLPGATVAEPLDGIYDERLGRTPPEAKVRLALDLEARTRAADRRVTGVESASYGDAVGRVAIASSAGVLGSFSLTVASCGAVALAAAEGEAHAGWASDAGRALEDLDPAWVAGLAAERAGRMLGATKPPTRTVPVLFDRDTVPGLLGVVLAGLSAEAVQKRRSLFADRVGASVAGPRVDLIDDGRLVAGGGAAPFDGEGVPTRQTRLIQNGVLRGYLHNTATAVRAETTSTGNANRGSFKTTPGVGAHCVFLQPGHLDQRGLLEGMGDGLFVQQLSGLHSGANPVTGDFSVGASGLWVRGGALAEPVREVTVAAPLLELLQAIVHVGSDLRFMGGPIGAVSLLVGQMTVAGA